MSYSLDSQCSSCHKQDKCVDQYFVQAAIFGIHSVNGWSCKDSALMNRGHLGGGVIKIDCQNFEPISKET